MHVPTEFLQFANELADASGEVIRPYYRSNPRDETKGDQTPVTVADREAEARLRALVKARYPDHGIIGEEHGTERADAEWVWVFDPIDGTKAFMSGRPLFVTLIALLHRGVPVLGIIDQPVIHDRWCGAHGHPTTLNGQPVATSSIDEIPAARIGTTGPQYLDREAGGFDRFYRLARQCRFQVYGGDGYLYGQLAAGGLELVIECGLKLWDVAALVPVIHGAGGLVTDWSGRPITADSDGTILAAANAPLHATALAQLQQPRS